MNSPTPPTLLVLHGIRNCDTMRKARAWLDTRAIAYRFHDYKQDGAPRALLVRWCETVGWETLLNRSGTTFRRLSDTQRTVSDSSSAIDLMAAHPSLIRRPVLDIGGRLVIGFKPDLYEHEHVGR